MLTDWLSIWTATDHRIYHNHGIPQGPDTEQDPRKSASYSFSGVQNTSRAGTPVPIVYGKTLTGSVVISAGVDTVQVQS